MNFWLIIYNYQRWAEFYQNKCSLIKLPTEEDQNIPLGMLYAFLGIFFFIIYIPFLIVMLRPEFIQYPCYKLMFLISLFDLMSVPCDGLIAGIQSMVGAHFCTSPVFFWFTGNINAFAWYGATFSCVLLAIDRVLELCWSSGAEFIFGGKRIYFWLFTPIVYTCFISSAFIYNTKRYTYYTDPFLETELGGDPAYLPPVYHFIHNVSVSISLGVIYIGLVIFMTTRSILYPNVGISKMQKIMTLQALCICLEMFITAFMFALNEMVIMPKFLDIVAHIFKIAVHGDTPLVYFCLNKSLRHAIYELISRWSDTAKRLTKIIRRQTSVAVRHTPNYITHSS